MKIVYLIILATYMTSCSGQKENKDQELNNNFIVTFPKDGQTVTDTVLIKDTVLLNELNRMMSNPNYKPRIRRNDTIFNELNKPTLVRLGNDIFGAQLQKFEYDSLNRLHVITGCDNKGIIKPFYHNIAIEKYKFDNRNNITEIRRLGADGKLISSEFEDTPIVKRVYNEKNQQIEEWYLNEYGELRSEYAIMKYKYTDLGDRIKDGWYNKEGLKIE